MALKHPLRHPSRLIALAALLLAGCDGSGGGSGSERAPKQPEVRRAPPSEAAKRPNVVVIYTDDQRLRSFQRRYMPRTMRLLGDGGTVFESYVVATPLCCPSRASFLSGAYPHNSGVFRNHNGYQHLRDKANTLGGWMQRAGYRTAWIGKFLQGYKNVPDPSRPAPGFDDWAVTLRAKYYEWKLFTDEGKLRGGNARDDYYTAALTRRAVELVDEQAAQARSLFMVLNHLAPHRGKGAKGRCRGLVAPAPGDRGRFDAVRLPRPPSFNEVDPSDRKRFSYDDAGLDREELVKERFRHRCRLESLLAVDRGIAELYRAFERNGELQETVFVFTSDNGLLLGEHGLTGKGIPYEEGIHVPLAIRVPQQLLDGHRVGRVDELVASVDITATILDLAGAQPCWRPGDCRPLDGRSLVPLIEGRARGWPEHRAIPIEGGDSGPCGYRGLRLESSVWLQEVEMGAGRSCEPVGRSEYYDLAADPHQLDNLAATAPARVADRIEALRRRSARLSTCVGVAGREPRPKDAVPCE